MSTTIYFNPFAFSIEQNNEFLRLGYEPMPMRIPRDEAAPVSLDVQRQNKETT